VNRLVSRHLTPSPSRDVICQMERAGSNDIRQGVNRVGTRKRPPPEEKCHSDSSISNVTGLFAKNILLRTGSSVFFFFFLKRGKFIFQNLLITEKYLDKIVPDIKKI
jgi:hypothetical protein